MSDSLAFAVEAWFAAALSGPEPDVDAIAGEHGVDAGELQAQITDARWLVARHKEAGVAAGTSAVPSVPFMLGDFEVLAEAGRGGMGIVFLARQRSLGREVAIKVLDPRRVDDAARARFLREARAAASLQHQNVVQVLAAGETDALAWYAMEWIEGASLAEILRQPCPAGDATRHRHTALLIAKVGRALQHAHEHGLLHRDVKPGNILIDRHGEPRLADFGLVKDLNAVTLTGTGALVGSPAYMSPEQLIDEADATPRSDVFALGVTLYECLTRQRPFRGATTSAIAREQMAFSVRLPRALDACVPLDLQSICLRAMATEIDARYPSAAALAADLEAFVRGEPVRARPPSRFLRIRRLLRRRRRALVALGATVVLTVAAAVGWTLTARAQTRAHEFLVSRLYDVRLFSQQDEFMPLLRDAVDRHPREPRVRLLAAVVDARGGRLVESAAHVSAVASAAADPGLALLAQQTRGVGGCLRGERRPDDALLAGLEAGADTDAMRCWLRGELLHLLRRFVAGSKMLERARQLDPALSVHVGGSLVQALAQRGEMRAARDEARALARIQGSAGAMVEAVRYALLAGDQDSARADARSLRVEFPSSGCNLLADLLLLPSDAATASDLDARLATAREHVDWPTLAKSFLNIAADRYRQNGAVARAAEIWRELVRLEPDNPSLRGLLGSALLQLSDEHRDAELRGDGLEQMRLAAELSRDRDLEHDVHAATYLHYSGDHRAAEARMRVAVERMPAYPRCWRQLAGIRLALAHAASGAERIEWLRLGAQAQAQEVALADHDRGAWLAYGKQLLQLQRELAASDDAEADVVGARLADVRARLRLLAAR